ncbi:MAG: hypothetical protein IJ906_07820 [Oscillospiraceae bacterium]|nr:hypothetical protein [Oscillospiraceae bacterium]
MKKRRLISAILSAAMMIACTAAPFPQGMIHPFTNEMSVYAASEIYTTPDGYRYKIDTVNKTASFIGYFSYGEELVIPSKVTAVIKDSYELECTVTNFDIRNPEKTVFGSAYP